MMLIINDIAKANFHYLLFLAGIVFLYDEFVNEEKTFKQKPSSKRSMIVFVVFSLFMILLYVIFSIPLPNLEEQNLQGKSFLITGCTETGVGFQIALTLLRWHASNVVCTMRDEGKKRQLMVDIKKYISRPDLENAFHVELLDLSYFDSVRSAAKTLVQNYPNFDGIALNAGVFTSSPQFITKDGFNEIFQVNFLSQFLLVRLLEQHLTINSRVAFVSSPVYIKGTLDRDVYSSPPGGRGLTAASIYEDFQTYCDSKLMQYLATKELAKRIPKSRINCVSPGFVSSNIFAKLVDRGGPFWIYFNKFSRLISRTTAEGAIAPLKLLTDPNLEQTGKFFHSYVALPESPEVNEENAKWLYEKSNAFVGMI